MQWFLWLTLTALVVTRASGLGIDEALELREQAAREDADEYLDDVVETLQEFAEDQGLDPLELPDRIGGFSVQVLLHTWHGEGELIPDWIQHLVPAHRTGEAQTSSESNVMRAMDDVEFDDLLVSYLYLAKIMKIGHIGDVFGQVEDLRITVDIKKELKMVQAYFQDLRFANIWNHNPQGPGGCLHIDLSTAIYRVFSRLFRNTVLKVLLNTIRQTVQSALAQISVAQRLAGARISNMSTYSSLEYIARE